MVNVIIICFTDARSKLTLWWSPVLPPWDAGNTGDIHNHAFLQQEAVTPLVGCVDEVAMTTPGSRASPEDQGWGAFSQSGSVRLVQQREPGLQWRRPGAQVSAAFGEARAAAAGWSSQHTFSRHSAPSIVGEPGQQGERSHFAFSGERAEKWAAQGIWQGEEWKADSCQQLSCKIALEATQGAW